MLLAGPISGGGSGVLFNELAQERSGVFAELAVVGAEGGVEV